MFALFQKYHARSNLPRKSLPRRAFGFVWIALFLAIVAGSGWMLFQQTVHTQIRDRVQAKIAAGLEGTGLTASLGQARFHEGQGIQLNDLRIQLSPSVGSPDSKSLSANVQSKIEAYEVFLHAQTSMTELASSELDIQHVEFRRVKLTLVRTPSGEWDFLPILNSLKAFKPDPNYAVPISLTDCEIQIFDQSIPNAPPIVLSNISVKLQSIDFGGRKQLQIEGGFQSPAISRIEFTTYLDQQAEYWKTRIGATDAQLSGELVSMLPPSIRSELSELHSVSGKINFTADVTGRMSLDELPTFELSGDVQGLTIDDARLPLPIRNVSADIFASNAGFAISKAKGKLGMADFDCNYWQRGYLERQQWHCDGVVNRFNFDHSPRLSRWLPDYCKKFCQEYSPSGTSDIQFDLTDDGTQLQRSITGKLTGMAFSYLKFPYKVENCVGTVRWEDDLCNFDVRSLTGKQEIEFKGSARGFGKQPTYQINVTVPGTLPIDQKLRDALDAHPKMAAIINDFSPSGRVTGIAKIEKLVPNGVASKSFDIRLHQCSIEHRHFTYPIHDISGLIQVRNDSYTFNELSGSNSSGKVSCNGTWNPIGGLNTTFHCSSVPLDDQLRFALKPDHREIWNGFRPRGTLDYMKIDMKLPIDKNEIDLVVEARMQDSTNDAEANYISIFPVWFPYQINHLTGMIKIGGGQITLTDVKGKHQRTWMVCQGRGKYTDHDWSVKLVDMLVGSLKVDEELLAAVPKSLAPPIRGLKFQGLLHVSGEIEISGNSGDPRTNQVAAFKATPRSGNFSPIALVRPTAEPTSNMKWDLRFDTTQAKMNVGLPVENVFGSVKLRGEYDGENAVCEGELAIDSLTVYDAQITKISGPIWLDNTQAATGQFAKTLSSLPQYQGTIPNETQTVRSLSAKMHEGVLQLDAQILSGGTGDYFVQATLNDACLATTCREFGAKLDNIEGHSYAALTLEGDYSGIHSQRGHGFIKLRNAKIYELPAFVSLLKLLKVRQLTRTAFDSSDIDFTVRGDEIHFDRMEFIGDAISLIGNGKMNLNQDIDLNFYSVMGRNKINIPLLSELYRAGSQKILWINVLGTLENPRTERHMLPQLAKLNDSLKQLFQPMDRPDQVNPYSQPTKMLNRAPLNALAPSRSADRTDQFQSPNGYSPNGYSPNPKLR